MRNLVTMMLAALLLLLCAAAGAQDFDYATSYDTYYPLHAKGHAPNPFDVNGIDDINLFNGNLVATIPLGPELNPGGDLTVQLALLYNSGIWSTEPRCWGKEWGDCTDHQYDYGAGALQGVRYAGLGWDLSFGHVTLAYDGLYLVSADGGRHQLFRNRYPSGYDSTEVPRGAVPSQICGTAADPEVYYSHDGSALRASCADNVFLVELPGGLTKEYGKILSNYSQNNMDYNNTIGRDFARMRDGWYCTKISDRWGAEVQIEYHTGTTYRSLQKNPDMSDGPLQAQAIPALVREVRADGTILRRVRIDIDQPGTDMPWRITGVRFQDHGGADFLSYQLSYYTDVDRLPILWFEDCDDPELPCTPQADRGTDWVYLLEKVQLIEEPQVEFGFGYGFCDSNRDDAQYCPVTLPAGLSHIDSGASHRYEGQRRGVLNRLDLPTGASIEYEYDLYSYWYHTTDFSSIIDEGGPGTCTCPINGYPYDIDPDCTTCGLSKAEGECMDDHELQLGVSERRVIASDDSTIEWTSYDQGSSADLNLGYWLDVGDSTWAPLICEGGLTPACGGNPAAASLHSFYTSSSATSVIRHWVADDTGNGSWQGVTTRDDTTIYRYSLGRSIIEWRDPGDCDVTPGEVREIPLKGALISTEQYRGSGAGKLLLRTTANAYTVIDAGRGWGQASGLHEAMANQRHRRLRATITYYHDDVDSNDDIAAAITTYRYETDDCQEGIISSGCSGITAAAAVPGNTTQVRTVERFLRTSFDSNNLFAPLGARPIDPDLTSWDYSFADLAGSFDHERTTTYWKGAHDGSDWQHWILSRPASEGVIDLHVVDPEVAASETTYSYGTAPAYPLLKTRVRQTPGSDGADDLVTAYEHITDPSISGYGQPRVQQKGLGSDMAAASWTNRAPDQTVWMAYEHEVVSGSWLVCLDSSRCGSWLTDSATGLAQPVERQVSRTISPRWRRPLTISDADGHGVELHYDAIGRLDRITPTSPELAVTELVYSIDPPVTEVWLPATVAASSSQKVAFVEFDGLGRPIHEARVREDLSGFRHRTLRYDGVGQLWRDGLWLVEEESSDPTMATRVLRFDPFGRAERSRTSDGAEILSWYRGVRIVHEALRDPDLDKTLRHKIVVSDARGDVDAVWEDKAPDSHCTASSCSEPVLTGNPPADYVKSTYQHDLAGNLVLAVVTGRDAAAAVSAQPRSFEYDARGLLLSELHPELGYYSQLYRDYTALGTAREVEQPDGLVLRSTLDAAGRVVATEIQPPGGSSWFDYSTAVYGREVDGMVVSDRGKVTQTRQYNYLTRPQDGVAAEPIVVSDSYTYDGPQGLLGSRTTTVQTPPAAAPHEVSFRSQVSYDRWANVDRRWYPTPLALGDCGLPESPEIVSTWNVAGLLSIDDVTPRLRGGVAVAESMSYDPGTGVMTAWSTAAGTLDSDGIPGIMQHNVSLDLPRSRIASVSASRGTDQFSTGDYAYDRTGNITAIGGAGGWSYQYDALSRLTGAQLDQVSRDYSYDDFGNIIELAGQTVPVDPASNRLAGDFAYDQRGNLTNEPMAGGVVRQLRFDAGNRLMAVWDDDDDSSEDYGFAYDVDGERILRYAIDQTSGALIGAWFTLRDGAGNVLSELQWTPFDSDPGPDGVVDEGAGDWARLRDYVYLDRNAAVQLQAIGGGGDEDVVYTSLVQDHLGSTRVEAADSWSEHAYWPFGDMVEPVDPIRQSHLFTGHEREHLGTTTNALLDLDYMHARYYSFSLGRFNSIDPVMGKVGTAQTWNRYSYVVNNPLILVDPGGLMIEPLTAKEKEELRRAREEARRQRKRRIKKARRMIRKLSKTQKWKLSSPTNRFEMIVRTAAKNTNSNQEALEVAFSAVSRHDPLGKKIRADLRGMFIPPGRDRGPASGRDKAEHLLANARVALFTRLVGLDQTQISVGDFVENQVDPRVGGVFDPGDMQANRAGVALAEALATGQIDLRDFYVTLIP